MARSDSGIDLTWYEHNIKGNNRKKILVVGKTGSGKSSLCNVLAGDNWNGEKFKVDGGANSCTQKTQFTNGELFGDGEKVTVIDSVGFDDPDNKDVQIIGEMVDQLNNNCDFINLFVIVIRGNERVEMSLKTILSVFEGMFGQDFWKQAVVCFTRIRMRKTDIENRLESNQNKSDDDMAKDFLTKIQKSFPSSKDVQWIRLDTHYKKTDENEKKEYDAATVKVKDLLEKNQSVLSTEEIRRLEKKIPAYKQKLKEIENEKKEIEEKYNALFARAQRDENELKELQEFKNQYVWQLFLLGKVLWESSEKELQNRASSQDEQGKEQQVQRIKNHSPIEMQSRASSQDEQGKEQKVQRKKSIADGCGCWPFKRTR